MAASANVAAANMLRFIHIVSSFPVFAVVTGGPVVFYVAGWRSDEDSSPGWVGLDVPADGMRRRQVPAVRRGAEGVRLLCFLNTVLNTGFEAEPGPRARRKVLK